jgi:hypothetical protein
VMTTPGVEEKISGFAIVNMEEWMQSK